MNDSSKKIDSDTLEGTQNPRLAVELIGHTKPWQTFLQCQIKGKIHHAWILSGPKGVGKATFAWKLANEIFKQGKKTKDTDYLDNLNALKISNLFLCRRPLLQSIR